MRAGSLSAELDGVDLLSVRWGGLEVASRIQVTVRDERWGTLRPTPRRAELDQRADGFTLALEAVHADGAFAWRGTVMAAADGRLDFEIDAVAERDFVYRRIGICVEHPWAPYVDATFRASGAGHDTQGTFPREIAPQPMVDGGLQPLVPAFRNLAIDFVEGVRATFMFDGEPEGHELEDQRNWTDASFKSYPTPLRISDPRRFRRGERLRQRLSLHVEGPAQGSRDDQAPIRLTIGGPTAHVMPDVGVSAPVGPADIRALHELDPAHLRLEVSPAEAEATLEAASSLARVSEVPLELVYLTDDVSPTAPGADVPLARVMVLRRSGATSDGSFIARHRARLKRDGIPFCGGTASHFSELNRRHPDPRGMDAIALAVTPQMHTIDERSMVATLEIQGRIVTRLQALTDGLPVVVSPVTLAAHHGSRDDVNVPDERVHSAFAAAWTAGSLANLAQAGAASVTVHEAVDRTVLASAALSAVVRELTARRRLMLSAVRSSDPRRVVAIAAGDSPILLANLTREEQEVVLEGSVKGHRALGPYEVVPVERSLR